MAKPFIRIYTQPSCQPCRLTKKRLNDAGVDFEDLPAAEHLELFEELDVEKVAPLVTVLEHWGDAELIVDYWTGYKPDTLKEYIG